MGRRVVEFNREGKAVALYENVEEASKATGLNKNNIIMNILGYGKRYIFNSRFE